MTTQYLVIHIRPNGEASVMPAVFASAITAGIHRDHLNGQDHDGKGGLAGHSYVTARVPLTLDITAVTPAPERASEPWREPSDEELSARASAPVFKLGAVRPAFSK